MPKLGCQSARGGSNPQEDLQGGTAAAGRLLSEEAPALGLMWRSLSCSPVPRGSAALVQV